jgi:general secretion pathway protein D
MKVVLEISNESGTSNIGGITQPIISQRKIEHEIRLKDGEMNLLGGILEEQQIKSKSGTPILGQIPILGHLFSQEKNEKVNNEIVFLLIPHIVRGQELSELNQRSFDVGTGTGIGLRANPKPPAKTAENTSGQPSAPVAGIQPPAQATPVQTVPSQPQAGVQGIQQQPTSVQQQPGGQPQQQPAVIPQQATQIPGQPGAGQQNPSVPPATTPEGKPSPATPANGPVTLQLTPGSITPAQGSSFTVNIVCREDKTYSLCPCRSSTIRSCCSL